MAQQKSAKKTVIRRRRERKNIEQGQVHIQSSFNNTIVTITDMQGNAISWAAAGGEGVRRFTTNFLKEYGLRCMEIVLVTLYVLMVDRIENSYSVTNNLGLISRILMPVVLSVSVFTIDKKFEKLFH